MILLKIPHSPTEKLNRIRLKLGLQFAGNIQRVGHLLLDHRDQGQIVLVLTHVIQFKGRQHSAAGLPIREVELIPRGMGTLIARDANNLRLHFETTQKDLKKYDYSMPNHFYKKKLQKTQEK